VFVPFVLPDEVVAVEPREKKKKFIRGNLKEIVTPSPHRAEPPCSHFTRCGGCHYQHIPYEAQLEFKAAILRETLHRIGRVEWNGPIQTHASPPLGYRNRAQWKIRRVGAALRIGYFQAGTTALCAVEQCPILAPRLEEVLGALAKMLEHGALPETLREVEAFANDNGRVLLNVSLAEFPPDPAALASALRESLLGTDTVLLHETARDRFELYGPGHVPYRVGAHEYRVGHLSFFQANRFLLEELVQTVVGDAHGKLALDLYCGVGFFTVALAKRFQQVVAVESNAAATRDLEANLGGSAGVRVVQREATEAIAKFSEQPDLIVLDPPRTGVEKGAFEKVLAVGASEVRYLSCDPATLARDLSAMQRHDYTLEQVHLFDLFPQTYHIETLALLRRSR
jgi:23S rRNA (uracil1939-C5)-methyltransferase